MKQKVVYMFFAACFLFGNASDGFARPKMKVENIEIVKLKGKIENIMAKVDAPHPSPSLSLPMKGHSVFQSTGCKNITRPYAPLSLKCIANDLPINQIVDMHDRQARNTVERACR